MFQLRLLGGATLLGPDGPVSGSAAQRRRLAILALLATARDGTLSRDRIVAYLWPEAETARARHYLSVAVYSLRSVLGDDALITAGGDLRLDRKLVPSDVADFDAAAEAGDLERAAALYGGPFLDGFHVAGAASELEGWVAAERERLRLRSIEVLERLATQRTAAGDDRGAVEAWRRAVQLDPLGARGAVGFMRALERVGDRAGALRHAQLHASLLREELAADPDPHVEAHAGRLRQSPEPGAALAVASVVATPAAGDEERASLPDTDATAVAPAAAATTTAERRATPVRLETAADAAPPEVAAGAAEARAATRPRRLWWWLLSAAAVVLAAAGLTALRARSGSAEPPGARVAVLALDNLRAEDRASDWLEDGLPQMIVDKLSRSTGVEVIAPERVRYVLDRTRPGAGAGGDVDPPPLGDAELRELARQLGATLVVTGGFTRGDTTLVLRVAVHDGSSGAAVGSATVTGRDAVDVADAAAVRVLESIGATQPGPRLAEVETRNVEAYQHFTRAVQADAQGDVVTYRNELDLAITLDSGFVSALYARAVRAFEDGDTATTRRLGPLLERNARRASEWDRVMFAAQRAFWGGENAQSEALARTLVERFPRDPRAHQMLARFYESHGRFDDAAALLRRGLALDSLAIAAGRGSCAPCGRYGTLSWMEREQRGDLDAADRVVRRWLEVQPDNPGVHSELAYNLAGRGRWDEALAAAARIAIVSGGASKAEPVVGRILIMARRLDDADTLVRRMVASQDTIVREDGYDLRVMLERERGRLRESNRDVDAALALLPGSVHLLLVKGNTLGRLGDAAGARAVYESQSHSRRDSAVLATAGAFTYTATDARAFAWHHALLADAVWETADVAYLHALADSIQAMSARSYYGRDWRLHHHVRGLIAMRAGRYDEAARELEQARWGPVGWTRTLAELADAYVALGRPQDAVATLRYAYLAPVNAMGRYLPRSEVDLRMARAFRRAGMADSAALYEGYARRAWKDADPEVKRLLE